MNIIYSRDFLKILSRLPESVQIKLDSLLEILEKNYLNPLLHTKRLSGSLANLYSFRITRDYRVIFMFEYSNVIKLLEVGHRKDIYR